MFPLMGGSWEARDPTGDGHHPKATWPPGAGRQLALSGIPARRAVLSLHADAGPVGQFPRREVERGLPLYSQKHSS